MPMHARDCEYVTTDGPAPCTCGYYDTVDGRGLDHASCKFSTGIDDNLTAGQGKLDEHGFWSIPCPECADALAKKLADTGHAVIV